MVVKKEKWEREGPLATSKIVHCAAAGKQAVITSLALKAKPSLETMS